LKEYNPSIEQKVTSVDTPYKSPLERIVPFVSKPSEWYADKKNWNLCTHCKENETPKTKFRLIPFCNRCYSLMALRHDGTFITPEFRVALAQDFEDLQKKATQKPEEPSREIIDEELPPII
jgi:hypothetical protein